MKRFYLIRYAAIALCLLHVITAGCIPEEISTPRNGQGGKNGTWVLTPQGLVETVLDMANVTPSDYAIWVPTPQELVEAMLDMANIIPSDYVIGLGSGDGRLVIAAAKRGATALGIEYNSDLVEFARRAAVEKGVNQRAMFEKADIFESDFSKATVITLFLQRELNLRLRPIILDMKPGTRVVSNTFDMGD